MIVDLFSARERWARIQRARVALDRVPPPPAPAAVAQPEKSTPELAASAPPLPDATSAEPRPALSAPIVAVGSPNHSSASGARAVAWGLAAGAVAAIGVGVGVQIVAGRRLTDFNKGCEVVDGTPLGKAPSTAEMD